MAVYTQVSDKDLAQFLTQFHLGEAVSLKGIAEGVENSNFFLDTEKGRFILTLYEKRVRPADLPFFLDLMKHLADAGLPSAAPEPMLDGALFGELAGRPAAIIGFLEGLSAKDPDAKQCAAVGEALARLHQAGESFSKSRENTMGIAYWPELVAQLTPEADNIAPNLSALLTEELQFQTANWPHHLPTGIVHADLFPDNVLFTKGKLTGLIDFYFACNDLLVYDLAVCLTSWCFSSDGQLNRTNSQALIAAYQSRRKLQPTEIEALPQICRAVSLRFLLSRAHDWINRVEGALVAVKDPSEYIQKLQFHRQVRDVSTYADF